MTTLVVLHSAYGLTRGVRAVVEALEPTGLRVVAPDYYRGRVFTTQAQAVAHRDVLGREALLDRVRRDLADVEPDAAFLGFSLGGSFAQELVTERPTMRHLILAGFAARVRSSWPGIPVQLHRFETDPWVLDEDVRSLRDAVTLSGATFEDHVTPGKGHLVSERHLPEHDPTGAATLVARVHDFLDWA